ncbi:MAG: hypothetical protein SVY15_09155 [Halobacteriota archaeon]|nr:hypothetical protein [Halobacteriota archaeon]
MKDVLGTMVKNPTSAVVVVIVIVCVVLVIFSGCIEQDGTSKPDLTLSNYPELFEKDVIIVIGENASQVERESAEAIAANLENSTGNKPMIKSDGEIAETNLGDYNLLLVGTPESNKMFKEVYNMTDATRVTDGYPGEGKGVLEVLKSPWNEDKAMLLVEGIDECGVKEAEMKLLKNQFKDGKKLKKVYSTEFVAKMLNVPTLSVSNFENDILEDVFGGYQFFEIYDGSNIIPPQRSVIALGSNGKPMDFNSLLRDANVNIKNDNKAIRVSKAFIIYFSADGLSGFKFLSEASEIPHQEGDFKNPVNYTEKIQPASVNKIDDVFVVILYTWCEEEGILIEWQVKIKDDKIASVFGTVIDTGIGHFKPRTEGVVHVPGYLISEEFEGVRR